MYIGGWVGWACPPVFLGRRFMELRELRLGKPQRGKSIAERIDDLSMPEPNSGCWLWVGACDNAGYGILRVNGHTRHAHRMSCEVVRGPISGELVVDHLCRNPACVNPDHLEPVTQRENHLRNPLRFNKSKGEFCMRGHRYTEENTMWQKTGRLCRTCHRERCKRNQRRYLERIRQRDHERIK
jgi:hypothetical protein